LSIIRSEEEDYIRIQKMRNVTGRLKGEIMKPGRLSLLGSGSVNTSYPRQRRRHPKIGERREAVLPGGQCRYNGTRDTTSPTSTEERCFLLGPCRGYIWRIETYYYIQYIYNSPRVKAASNTPTLALQVVGGDEKGTQCLGV
jgi:hypothetical protein